MLSGAKHPGISLKSNTETLRSAQGDNDEHRRTYVVNHWDRRLGYFDALGEADAIAQMLPDWDARKAIGSTLKVFEQLHGWKPTMARERVYVWICDVDKKSLTANWETTNRVLLTDLNSGDPRKVENAVYTAIALGRKEMIPRLMNTLNTEGNKVMAETFLNSGNKKLADAAQSWADAYGFNVVNNSVSYEGQGASEAGWGSGNGLTGLWTSRLPQRSTMPCRLPRGDATPRQR